jgi:hypothetical protein
MVRFLSIEPMIGEIVLGLMGNLPKDIEPSYMNSAVYNRINWVIVGCESGPGARPCPVEWIRAIRDECAESGVAFFLKQAMEDMSLGIPAPGYSDPPPAIAVGRHSERKGRDGRLIHAPYLDGYQHVAFPEIGGSNG